MIPRYEQLPDYMFAMNEEEETAVLSRLDALRKARRAITVEDLEYMQDHLTFKDVKQGEEKEKLIDRIMEMEYRFRSLCYLFSWCRNVLSYFTEFIGKEVHTSSEEEEEDFFSDIDGSNDEEEDQEDLSEMQERFSRYLSCFSDLAYLDVLLDASNRGSRDAEHKLKDLITPYRSEMLILVRTIITVTNLTEERQDIDDMWGD